MVVISSREFRDHLRKYTVEISSKARKELQIHYKAGNKSDIRKIEQIFLELTETPFEGPDYIKSSKAGCLYWLFQRLVFMETLDMPV